MNSDDTLREFGTISIGFDWMLDHIEIDKLVPGRVDATNWWATVPVELRQTLWPCINEICQRYIGGKLIEQTLRSMISEMHSACVSVLRQASRIVQP